MFSRRKIRPRLVRFLYRQLDNPEVLPEYKELVAQVLSDRDLIDELNRDVTNRAVATGAPKLGKLYNDETDHPFLDWLKENWVWILKLILQLLGVPDPIPVPPNP